uniref:Secreted protein n=1 Tax=Ixodes scapularis TaxID=6945 RepID=A0A4D5RFM8_IXOSC
MVSTIFIFSPSSVLALGCFTSSHWHLVHSRNLRKKKYLMVGINMFQASCICSVSSKGILLFYVCVCIGTGAMPLSFFNPDVDKHEVQLPCPSQHFVIKPGNFL